MKILFQIRSNAFTQRGGDTVDLERISSGLSALGVTVKIDLDGSANLKDFDCIFLFNFTIPQLLRQQAERAVQAGVPYVVLALNEDIPNFHNQSHLAAAALIEYVNVGQPKNKFAASYPDVWTTAPAGRFENEWVARNAAVIFTTGARESRVLAQYYPGLNNLYDIPLGFDPMKAGSATAFEAEFGIKDYVLSVGRLETRKNQLMLLKALEDEDIPVVIASGGFTYQPDYDRAVRSFKRLGRTIILEKLSDIQLANAYAAAKIHALPSWYELPGLVSMEAASCGKNVVVSDQGTTRDYFEDDAFYSDPASPESVKNAVLAALYSPVKVSLSRRVANFTWETTAKRVLEILGKTIVVKSRQSEKTQQSFSQTAISADSKESNNQTQSIAEIIQQAEQIARAGDFSQALDLIIKHKLENPRSSGLWRAQGMLLIALEKHKEAQSALQTALSLDPQDSRIVCGLGICAKQEGNQQLAHDLFVKSLQLDKSNKVAILQLLSVSYEINNFVSLEAVLRNYVAVNSAEIDMKYALAGCLYRQGKLDEAGFYCKEIISRDSNHVGSIELLALISKSQESEGRPNTVKLEQIDKKDTLTSSAKARDGINKIIELKRDHKISQGLQECSSLLGDLVANDPELEEIYSLQGELMALDGQIIESERRFNSILVQYPNSVRALCGLGALYGEQRNWTKAEEFFRKAIAVNPACDVGFAGLALSSLQAGDKEAAWHYYEKALSVNPENLRAVFGILELGYPQSRFSDIERVLKNYLELHPANLDFLYSLAGCFYAQNRLPEASQEIEKILMFSPEHSKAIELRQAIKNRLAQP